MPVFTSSLRSNDVAVITVEQEGDLSDHELEEFDDDNTYAGAEGGDSAGSAAVDLAALGATVPTATAPDDTNHSSDADADDATAAVDATVAKDDTPPSSPPPADDAASPKTAAAAGDDDDDAAADDNDDDNDWEKELADELEDFELVDGEDEELDDADLEDLDGMLDDVESTD